MSVEPHGAATRVVEAGEDSQCRVARPRQNDWQRPGPDGVADVIGELLVDARCRDRGVAKGRAAVDALDRDGEPPRGQDVVGTALDQPLRALARANAVVPRVIRDLNQANVRADLLTPAK
jgi:hypothetical protein